MPGYVSNEDIFLGYFIEGGCSAAYVKAAIAHYGEFSSFN